MTMTQYKILIKTITDRIITFTVEEYTLVDDNQFIEFTDRLSGNILRYHVSKVEIKVVEE